MTANLYDVLGVDPDASPELLRSAFRARAQALHPDLHPDDPDAVDAMRELNDAWHVLGHEARRAAYDERRRLGLVDLPAGMGGDDGSPLYDARGSAPALRLRRWRVPLAAIVLLALLAVLIVTAYAGPSAPSR